MEGGMACRGAALASSLCLFLFLVSPLVAADPLVEATTAYNARNYPRARSLFIDLAAAGNPEAQTYLARMYEKGLGVPQNYMVSAAWYRCAAGQGYPPAAYSLGLMYDKGHGVPQDYVLAYTWLNLAVAGIGPGQQRYYWMNIRDAIASKLSLVQKLLSQEMALIGPEPNVCPPLGYELIPDP
jgi:hypothetical protein